MRGRLDKFYILGCRLIDGKFDNFLVGVYRSSHKLHLSGFACNFR